MCPIYRLFSRLWGLDRTCRMALASPASAVASQASDYDVEDTEDAVDDGFEDGADAVDDGHDAAADGAEDIFDL